MSDLKGKYYWVKTPVGREVAFKRNSGKWELCGISNDEDCKDAILEVYEEVANGADKSTEPALHKHIVSNPVNCVSCGEPLISSETLNEGNCCDLCWLSN